VTSPTFVIAREHAALGRRPGLVHVDAYRLGSIEELDDLDLDTSLEDVVTVVEWGEGMAEALSPSRLEVRIRHSVDGAESTDEGVEPRVVEVQGIGPRWATHPNRPSNGPARR
ncbi:MAG: tRNA (adenosine(37)-N6)-threonylcarbamoyltransferase complex ATPase subunit type 1 TsaE, partial [Nocardioides sp.]